MERVFGVWVFSLLFALTLQLLQHELSWAVKRITGMLLLRHRPCHSSVDVGIGVSVYCIAFCFTSFCSSSCSFVCGFSFVILISYNVLMSSRPGHCNTNPQLIIRKQFFIKHPHEVLIIFTVRISPVCIVASLLHQQLHHIFRLVFSPFFWKAFKMIKINKAGVLVSQAFIGQEILPVA